MEATGPAESQTVGRAQSVGDGFRNREGPGDRRPAHGRGAFDCRTAGRSSGRLVWHRCAGGSRRTARPDAGRRAADRQWPVTTCAPRQVTARLTASNVTVNPVPGTRPGEILVPLDARLNGEWQTSGTVDDPQGSGQLTLDETRVLDRDIGRVSTRLTLADQRAARGGRARRSLHDRHRDARRGRSHGRVIFDRHADDGRGSRDAGLATARRHRRASDGTDSFAAHVEGVRYDVAHARTTVDLQRLEARRRRRARALDRTGPRELRRPHARRRRRGASALVRTAEVDCASRAGSALTRQERSPHRSTDRPPISSRSRWPLLPAGSFLADLQVDGRVHVDVRAPGSLDRPALDRRGERGRGTDGARRPAASVHAARCARLTTPACSSCRRLDATWQAATVSATGDIPIALVAPNAPVWLAGGRVLAADRRAVCRRALIRSRPRCWRRLCRRRRCRS